MCLVLETHKHRSDSSAGQAVFGASLNRQNTERQDLEDWNRKDRSVLREPLPVSISVQCFIATNFITISDTDLRGD